VEGQNEDNERRPAPGWYPDPYEANRLRKWDGVRWTDSWMAAPGGSVAARTSGPGSATATATAPLPRAATVAGWYADPRADDGVTRERYWDGESWTHRLRHGLTYPGRPPLPGWFGRVAWALRAALLLNGVGAAASLGMAIWTLSLSEQALDGAGYSLDEANVYDTLDLVVIVATSALYLLTIPLFLVWLGQAYRNDRVDPSRLTHSRGWAVGAWFAPFLNLVRPYRIVQDLRQGVRSGLGDDRPDPYPRSVGWWWAAWLVMNLAAIVSDNAYRSMERAEDDSAFLEAWRLTGWTEVVASLSLAVAAYLAYVLVTRITAGLRRPEFTDRSDVLPES
jgi:hypothetical protein